MPNLTPTVKTALFALVVQLAMPTPALTQRQNRVTSGAQGQLPARAQTKPAQLPHYSSGQMMDMLDQVESGKQPRPLAGGQSQYAKTGLAQANRGGMMGGGRSLPSARPAIPSGFSRGISYGSSQGVYRKGVLVGATGMSNGMGALQQRPAGAGQSQILGQLKQRFSNIPQGGNSGGQMQMLQQMLQRSGAQPGATVRAASGQTMGRFGAPAARLGGGMTNLGQQQRQNQSFASGTTGNGTPPASNSAGAGATLPAKGHSSMSDLEKQMDQQYGK